MTVVDENGEREVVDVWLHATTPGVCDDCGLVIRKGDRMALTTADRYLHSDCTTRTMARGVARRARRR